MSEWAGRAWVLDEHGMSCPSARSAWVLVRAAHGSWCARRMGPSARGAWVLCARRMGPGARGAWVLVRAAHGSWCALKRGIEQAPAKHPRFGIPTLVVGMGDGCGVAQVALNNEQKSFVATPRVQEYTNRLWWGIAAAILNRAMPT